MHFVCKEMCRKYYIIEQISGSLHEIQLCHVYLIHIFWYRKFNFYCSGDFGEAVGIDEMVLDSIATTCSPENYFVELLDYWLKYYNGRPTWSNM